jgi:hypothetical protein
VVLNGIKVLDFTDPRAPQDEGYIALQLHSGGDGNMRFKDLWVRDLNYQPPPSTSKPSAP